MAADLLLSPEHIRNFWRKVRKGGADDCWLWQGWRNHSGHARFEVAGQKMLATHISLILSGQPRPEPPGDLALHGDTCVSAACVNPDHLRWGTAKSNAEDRERLGRRTPARGEKSGQSKFTEDQVRFIRATDRPTRALARDFGVSQTAIKLIRQRKNWAHLP